MATANELLEAACESKIACLQNRDLLVIIADAIAQSAASAAPQQVYTGAAPPAAPDDPSLPALFYPTGGGTLLQWDGAAWV